MSILGNMRNWLAVQNIEAPMPKADKQFEGVPSEVLRIQEDLRKTMHRINSVETRKTNYPWKFIETGAMAGGISVKGYEGMEPIWHEKETPIFIDAVKAHNRKISAERRENKKNVVHT